MQGQVQMQDQQPGQQRVAMPVQVGQIQQMPVQGQGQYGQVPQYGQPPQYG